MKLIYLALYSSALAISVRHNFPMEENSQLVKYCDNIPQKEATTVTTTTPSSAPTTAPSKDQEEDEAAQRASGNYPDPLKPAEGEDVLKLCLPYLKSELQDVPERCIRPLWCDMSVYRSTFKMLCPQSHKKKLWTKQKLLGIDEDCYSQAICDKRDYKTYWEFFKGQY